MGSGLEFSQILWFIKISLEEMRRRKLPNKEGEGWTRMVKKLEMVPQEKEREAVLLREDRVLH